VGKNDLIRSILSFRGIFMYLGESAKYTGSGGVFVVSQAPKGNGEKG